MWPFNKPEPNHEHLDNIEHVFIPSGGIYIPSYCCEKPMNKFEAVEVKETIKIETSEFIVTLIDGETIFGKLKQKWEKYNHNVLNKHTGKPFDQKLFGNWDESFEPNYIIEERASFYDFNKELLTRYDNYCFEDLKGNKYQIPVGNVFLIKFRPSKFEEVEVTLTKAVEIL